MGFNGRDSRLDQDGDLTVGVQLLNPMVESQGDPDPQSGWSRFNRGFKQDSEFSGFIYRKINKTQGTKIDKIQPYVTDT